MTKAELRLEILKICFRRDQDALTIIGEAKKLEEYIDHEPEHLRPKSLEDREPSKAGRTAGKTAPLTLGKKE
jgi:hypothetical protein